MTAAVTIRIQQADFDIAQEISALTKGRTDIGAVVSFSGICRGSESSEPIAALTLEHYPEMAEAEIARHAETAMSRWPLTGLSIIHRDRKSTRLNSSHANISYAVFCLKKKKTNSLAREFWYRPQS